MAPHPPHTQLALTPVPAGTEIPFLDGTTGLSTADVIVISVLHDGEPTGTSLQVTPEEAIHLATALTQEASKLIGQEIDDNGNRLTPAARLRRLRDVFQAAGT